MNCPNCDNDLMVRLEPQGAMRFLRFLPMESYYCVKCGKRVTRLSGPSSNPVLGVTLMILVLAGMALAVWRSTSDREPAPPAPQAVAQAPAPAEQNPAPADPARGAVVQVPVPPAQAPATPEQSAPAPAAPAPKPAPPAPATPAPKPAAQAPAAPAPAPAKVAAPAGPRTIAALTATVEGGVTRISVRADGPIEGFSAFPLAGPPRFVLDLPGSFAYKGATSIPVAGSVLTGIRVGAYPNKVRLVLDYAKPGPDGRPAKPPVVDPAPQGLAITVE